MLPLLVTVVTQHFPHKKSWGKSNVQCFVTIQNELYAILYTSDSIQFVYIYLSNIWNILYHFDITSFWVSVTGSWMRNMQKNLTILQMIPQKFNLLLQSHCYLSISYILQLLSIITAYYNKHNIANCSKLKYCSHALQAVHPIHKESLTAVL